MLTILDDTYNSTILFQEIYKEVARVKCGAKRYKNTKLSSIYMPVTAAWYIYLGHVHTTLFRSIAPSSRPVARVHTGATGTLVPDPRDHLSTWNEWARSIAIGCALSNLSCGRSSGRYRPVSKSAAVGTRLLDLLLPLLGTCALSRVFNRLRHVKADTRTLISKVLQSSKPYSHTNNQ